MWTNVPVGRRTGWILCSTLWTKENKKEIILHTVELINYFPD